MADPFSVVVGVAGLLDLAAKSSAQVLRLIDKWKDAPRQIQFLAEEVNMSQQVAQQLKDLRETLERSNSLQIQGYDTAINLQLQRANPIWTELYQILVEFKATTTSKRQKVMWVKKASRVVTLQGKLRDVRFSTLEILAMYNV
jgi:hypothetical protein